jgi:LCP family protein required for cell wall assembly
MPHKKPTNNLSPSKPPKNPLRRSQDAAALKQAAQFPSVGVTLGSYKHNPFQGAEPLARSKPQRPMGRLGRFRQKFNFKRLTIFVVVIMLLAGLWVGGKFLYNAHKLFHGSILGLLTTTKLKGEDSGRVNILLAGNSADDAGHSGGDLTDSIMIMSIDTKRNQAFLMSVPRDLYVQIPGTSSHAKINYAYVAGKANNFSQEGYPAGGMGELESVINQDFGITINYYALVNYSALKEAVDAVGGIDVNIQSSDPRGLYDPNIDYATHGPLVKLTNGVHHLDGEAALDLSRARGDSYRSYGFAASDFERTKNQRDLLVALKTKAVTAGVLSNPAKLSNLSDAIGNNVKTDFNLSEVHRLYDLVKNINGGALQSYSLNSVNGKNLLASYTSPDGQSTLIPASGVDDYSGIQAFLQQITSSDPVIQEGAQVVLLNATATAGLASQQRTKLQAQHFQISDVGNATNQATTTIIQTTAGKDPNTLQALMKLYGKTAVVTATNPYANTYTADFIVLIGNDQLPAATSPAATTH